MPGGGGFAAPACLNADLFTEHLDSIPFNLGNPQFPLAHVCLAPLHWPRCDAECFACFGEAVSKLEEKELQNKNSISLNNGTVRVCCTEYPRSNKIPAIE